MSLKKKAAQVRAKGKKNIGVDSILAHITPEEAALLKARGGSGQADPDTGIPHFATSGGSEGSGGGWGSGGGFGDGADDSGGFAGYGDRGPNGSSGPMGVASDGYGGAGFGDATGDGVGLSSVFNAAMDSQMANEDGGFAADSSFDNPSFDPSPSWSSPTEEGWTLDKVMKNPFAKALMSMHPLSRAVSLGYGMMNAKSPMDAASSALGAYGGPVGSMAAAGINAANSSNPTASLGKTGAGMIGSTVGSALGGPVGGVVGGLAGGFAAGQGMSGQGSANSGAQGNTGSQAQGGIDYSALASGLGGLYANYRGAQQANQAADSLKDLYAPGGAYANQLRQTLERKDAAGGRRSQYGPREAQLTALLADKYAGNVMNMNKLQQNGLRSNGQMFSTGLNLLNKTGLLNKGASYLGNMFTGDATNGNGGFTSEGTTYNNPSAYSSGSAAPADTGGGNFWDNWI